MNIKNITKVIIPFAAVVAVVVVVLIFALPQTQYYAGGELIDVTHPQGIAYEEDGDPAELGQRLVQLAAGEHFTNEQIQQIADLTAGLFEEVRGQGMDIEALQAKVERLEARARQ